jgi:hypothetical protein
MESDIFLDENPIQIPTRTRSSSGVNVALVTLWVEMALLASSSAWGGRERALTLRTFWRKASLFLPVASAARS